MIAEIMSRVDIPKPGVPESEDVAGWGDKFGDWLTNMSPMTMKLIVIAIIAAFILTALRRSPFLKGAAVGVIILGIIAVAFL
jgi:hypothetical protein